MSDLHEAYENSIQRVGDVICNSCWGTGGYIKGSGRAICERCGGTGSTQKLQPIVLEMPKETPHPGYTNLYRISLDDLTEIYEHFRDLQGSTLGWGAMGIGLKKEYVAIIAYALKRLRNSRLALEPKENDGGKAGT